MNEPKVRAFFREFPFLKQYDYYPREVRVSRFNPEFLVGDLKMGGDDLGGWVEEIRILDSEGKELARVGRDKMPQLKPFWKRIFSHSKIASWKETYMYERVYETLLRIREWGRLSEVHYAISFFYGTLTLYKLPKGVDLSDWIDWLRVGGKKEELLSHENRIKREQSLLCLEAAVAEKSPL